MRGDKWTIVGDPHVTPKRLDDAAKLCKVVEALGNDTVWLGDMLDTKEVVRGTCLNFWFDYLKNSKLQHVFLVGNHDWFNLECQDHSLRPLKQLDNVTIVDELTIIDGVAFLPYLHKEEKLRAALKQVEDGATVFGHFELKGFDFGNGFMCEEGITTKTFKRFGRVISGHFHKHQESENVTYLGTPYSLNWGETNQVKYIAVYNKESDSLELRETKFPKHWTYEIDLDDPKIPEMKKQDHNRVILIGTQEQINLFDNSLLDGASIIPRFVSSKGNKVLIDESFSNKKKFEEWGNTIKKLEPETLQLGLSILKEVTDD